MRFSVTPSTRLALAIVAGFLLHTRSSAGNCKGDCCNPCPPYHSESFGFYATQWHAWPSPRIVSVKPSAPAALQSTAFAQPVVPAAATYPVFKVPEAVTPAQAYKPVVTALPPEVNTAAPEKVMTFRSENGTPLTVQYAPPAKIEGAKNDAKESWHNPVPPPLEKPYIP